MRFKLAAMLLVYVAVVFLFVLVITALVNNIKEDYTSSPASSSCIEILITQRANLVSNGLATEEYLSYILEIRDGITRGQCDIAYEKGQDIRKLDTRSKL